MVVEVIVPKYGMASSLIEVTKWCKHVGEKVKQDEILAEVMTEKVTAEIYSPANGILEKINIEEGESIETGKVIAEIKTEE